MSADPTMEAYESYKAQRHFANLDGLRCICIAMVLWHHSPPTNLPDWTIFTRGFLGVDFFFVLSGFLITTLLLREADTYGQISLRDFYIRRAIRILPIYFFVVSLIAFYYIVIDGQWHLLQILPYYYIFLSNFLISDIPLLGPTWSLSVEEQYYLVWPLLLLLVPRSWMAPVALVLIALNVGVGTGLIPYTPHRTEIFVWELPNSTYAPIILGSLAALLLHSRWGYRALFQLTGHKAAVLIWAALLLGLFVFAQNDVRGWLNLAIHTSMTLIVVALVLREQTVMTPFLTHPLMVRVGVVSYGIYLYHLLALDVVNRAMGMLGVENSWLVLGIYSALAFAIAEVSFRTLEAYFRRFRPAPRTPAAKPQPTA